MDYILNGEAHGSVAATLLKNNFDVGAFRPFIGQDGASYVTLMEHGKPVVRRMAANVATLRKEEWIELDKSVVAASRQRLRLVADVRAAGLNYVIPNGLSKTVLDTETMSDPGEAVLSMDGLAKSGADRPQFGLTHLPLPIASSDFEFSARQIAVSQGSSTPLDRTMPEAAGRRVADIIEGLFIGVAVGSGRASFTFGGGTIEGLTNHTGRNTASLTDPTDSAWTPRTTVIEILAMREQAQSDRKYGPYVLYVAKGWDQYLDDDYSAQYPGVTLRDRIKKIEDITDVRALDYMTDLQMVLVQMSSDVIRAVVGMEITTLQWPEQGGMKQCFKVMGITVPQVRNDYNGNCGIVHASVA